MILYPAMDFMNGRCVRLCKGEKDSVEYFDIEPEAMALKWERAGVKAMHLVDLDGAFTGVGTNYESLKRIRKAVKIPINIGGGIRTARQAELLIKLGFNVILGTMLVENPDSVKELLKSAGDKIIVAVDCKYDKVTGKGWTETTAISSFEYIMNMKKRGFKRFLYTDINKDGTMKGPNLESLKELMKIKGIELIASGGVGSIEDLRKLERMKLFGVVVGKGILSNCFTIEDALEVCNAR